MTKKLRGKRPVCYDKRLPLPINMLVEVTNACNNACIFCAHHKMKRSVGMMDINLFRSVAKQAYKGGVREIGFYMTGEPLMNKNLCKFVSYAKELGFEYIYMTTNGALADIDTMKVLIQSGINSIKFSINAGSEETYRKIHGRDNFETVISNLTQLSNYIKSSKLDVGLFVSYVVCRQNKDEVGALRDQIGELVDEMVAIDVVNHGGKMHEINEAMAMSASPRTVACPCDNLFNRLNVTCEGYLSACCVDFDNELIVADLNQMSLLEAWNSEKMVQLRQMHLNHDIPTDVMCYNCIHNENYLIKPY